MRTIRNLTASPLRVPLPGGKTLHLGPNETGSIRDAAVEHAALKKLVDAGSVEIGESERGAGGTGTGSGNGPDDAGTHGKSGVARKSGDR